MQLQELKKLVEYNAIDTLLATRCKDGWLLVACKDDSKQANNNNTLEIARGGVRKFATLDAVANLVKVHLYNSKFTVH